MIIPMALIISYDLELLWEGIYFLFLFYGGFGYTVMAKAAIINYDDQNQEVHFSWLLKLTCCHWFPALFT